MLRASVIGLGAVLALAVPASSGADDDGRPYYQVIYDYEMATQCGFASDDVERAFRRARDDEAARSGLAADALRRLRLKAIVAVHREYDNRGLGGHRQWCAKEGRQGVGRLLDGHR